MSAPKKRKAPETKKKPATKGKSIVPRKPDGKIDWPRYNEALKERGNIRIWIDKDALDGWIEIGPDVKTRGGQRVYSDTAIGCVLTLRSVFHLTLRQAEKFCRSILGCMGADVPAPDYSTLSRRRSEERRVGKECASMCRSRWSPYH